MPPSFPGRGRTGAVRLGSTHDAASAGIIGDGTHEKVIRVPCNQGFGETLHANPGDPVVRLFSYGFPLTYFCHACREINLYSGGIAKVAVDLLLISLGALVTC